MPAFIARAAGFQFPLVTPWPSIAVSAAAALTIALAATIVPLRALRRFNLLRAITIE